jgi:hypothetical protein
MCTSGGCHDVLRLDDGGDLADPERGRLPRGAAMIDIQARVQEMIVDWSRQPLYVLSARVQALRAMQANGVRLSPADYEAFLCMGGLDVRG